MKTVTRWIVIGLLLIAAIAWNTLAGAVQLDERGCYEYAIWSRDVIWAREVGADKEKVRVSLIELDRRYRSGVIRLVLRDFETLWLTQADSSAVAEGVLHECFRRRGNYGESI